MKITPSDELVNKLSNAVALFTMEYNEAKQRGAGGFVACT